MILLRNILFEIGFYLGSTVLVLMTAIFSLISPHMARVGARQWSRWVRFLAEKVLGIRTVIEGEIPSGSVIAAPKHESFFEALILPALFPQPAVVMKRELEKIPVWGWIVKRHGSIFVDRSAQASAMRAMLAQATLAKTEGREIVIFPEGSRADPGTSPPLKPGVAGIYRLLKLPVVPIALKSAHVWPKKGLRRPGIVPVKVLPAIPPGLSREELEARLHAAINTDLPT